MEVIELKTLTDYISKISNLEGYYFRGESADYGETKNTASGYRWLKKNDIQRPFSDLLLIREKFYQEIGYGLSEKDIENFISYSQHHGLPTELLDVTENPLVALYFSCQSNKIYNDIRRATVEQDGFIYSINKNRTIELQKKIISEDMSHQFLNFEDIIHGKDKELMIGMVENNSILFNYIVEYTLVDKKNYFLEILRQENDWIGTQYREGALEDAKKIDELLTEAVKSRDASSEKNEEIFNAIEDWSSIAPSKYDQGFATEKIAYNLCLFEFALHLHQSSLEFPLVNYFVHQPSVIFDRMINQQGKFIYQNHLINENQEMVIQTLKPDIIFKINAECKDNIIKELDNIGINKKFIYPDHDHIAEYVQDKYLP